MTATMQMRMRVAPLAGAPVFGDSRWLGKRGRQGIDRRRLVRAAAVAVDRTPLFRVAGDPEPIDPAGWEGEEYDDNGASRTIAGTAAFCGGLVVVDHDPARYAPYTDLVCDGDPAWSDRYYLIDVR